MGKFGRAVETILVASGDATVLSDGSTTLVDSNGNCNLANGQLGVFHATYDGGSTPGTAISVGDTVSDAPAIQIAQGTPYVSSPGPATYNGFFNKTHIVSPSIFGKLTRVFRGQSYTAPRYNAWVVGATEGQSDAISTPLDETKYSLRITMSSRRHEETFSESTRQSTVIEYTTPDYTTLGTTNPLDHLVQNMVNKINLQSRLVLTNGHRGNKDFIAFAVRHDEASNAFSAGGSVLISALDALAGGTAYPTTGYGGISTDAETTSGGSNSQQGAAWVAIAADSNNDIATTDAVVPINLTTAGSNTYGANGIVIMAIDPTLAYEDRQRLTKIKMAVSLIDGFGTATGLFESSDVQEAEGSARKVRLFYRDTAGQRLYSQNRIELPIVELLDPDVMIPSGEVYDTYIIESETPHAEGSYFQDNTRLQRTYVFIPVDNTTTTAAFEAALNPYFASADFSAVTL
jgi:hypothetical protein